jgi:integrase
MPPIRVDSGLCMRGGIYSREVCPVCGGKFQGLNGELLCPFHLTRPGHYFIALYDKTLKKHIYLYSDSRRNGFTSYEAASRILTKIRSEKDSGAFDVTRYVSQKLKPLKFSNWSEAWLKKKALEVEKGLRSPSYLKALRVYVRKYQGFFRETDIRDITTKMVEEFYLSLEAAPKYRKNLMDGLENMLRDALDYDDIKQLPKFPKVDLSETSIQTITLEDQDRVISSIGNPMDRTFLFVCARLMLRPSEVRALCWEDIDWKFHRVTVQRHFSLNELKPATKARNIKVLPIDEEIEQALHALPHYFDAPFVFWKYKGRPFSESWARRVWREASRKLGFDISLYQGCRHSSATAAAAIVGIDALQSFLHHTSRKMTLRYAKQDVESLRKVLRKK